MPLQRLRQLNTTECLWPYLLRLLREKPTHAYTLRAAVEKRYGFRPGIMTAYKVLYLLERERYVEKTAEGRKRVYRITPKGRAALREASGFYAKLARKLR